MNFYEQIFSRGRATGEGMTHFERLFAAKFGGSPAPEVREYTGAVPVTIIADGTPLLDYIISGNTVQNGTPTPESPVMPEGTGEKTANRFDKNNFTFGTDTTIVYVPIYVGEGNFTLSTDFPENNTRDVFFMAGSVSSGASSSGNGVSTTTPRTRTAIDGYVTVATRYNSLRENPANYNYMLNAGSEALPYQPHGYKIPISSGGVTTPVYLGQAQSTRKIKKLIFTGEETSWHRVSGFLYNDDIQPNYLRTTARIVYCTHYQGIDSVTSGANVGEGECAFYSPAGVQRLYIKDSNYSSVSAYQAYLAAQYAAGTPVTIWYVLAEPETGIVNEPLMKIGDYADTVSKEQAGVDIPTNNGSTTVDVETTVKPSEVYIKYMG